MTSPQKLNFDRQLLPEGERKRPPRATDDIPFGRVPTNHMLTCDFLPTKGGWQTPKIVPFQTFQMPPNALVFHYGQTIFEGLKAYRATEDANAPIYLFRPEMNAKRLINSANILGMEPVPAELFLDCVKELVKLEKDWILPAPASLYIRPSLIPLDDGVSVRASSTYRFFVILSPAKNYYSAEHAVSVYVERDRVRAAPGGTGEAKCGGNYAAALLSSNKAKKLGAEQVLWLDASQHKYVEEVGAMNVMFVYGNKIVTPSLSGSILAGVTRNSILQLAPKLGYSISEEKIAIADVLADAKSGKLTEIFGCGTAAVISPVSSLLSDSETVQIADGKPGKVSLELKKNLLGIQTGTQEDPFGWRIQI